MSVFDAHPIQDAKRFKEIVSVIGKYGLTELLERTHLDRHTSKTDKHLKHLTRGQKIRLIAQELGPTFIKFGQMLSVHADMIPKDIIEELEKLEDAVEPFPYMYVEKAFLLAFRNTPDELYKSFDQKPFASASISQVHRAVTKDNIAVAVKVQRPRIEKIVQTDVALMYIFVKLVEQYIPELKTYELGKLVREFERSIFREIDFRIEADNTETLTSAFTEIAAIRFPQVFHELSSEKVLTLTFIQGHKIQDVVKHRTFSQTERNQIANTGAQAICKQIFEDGFFHADPHSGNLLIQDDGGITFLDAGMVGHLSIENRRFLSQILIQIVDRNANGIITACLNENILPDSCDIGLLREDIDDLFVRYYGVSLKRIDLARSLSELFAIMFRHKVHLPSSFLLLMRTLIILEGVGVQLNPEFNPVEVIGPYARRLISHLYTPKAIASDIGQILKENIWTMRTLPGDLSLFIQRLLRGKTEIKLDHRGLDQLNATIDKAGSRFSAAILIAGIIVSSSLIMHAHIAPLIGGGTSILGLIGFLMAFVFAIRLITSIWKDF